MCSDQRKQDNSPQLPKWSRELQPKVFSSVFVNTHKHAILMKNAQDNVGLTVSAPTLHLAKRSHKAVLAEAAAFMMNSGQSVSSWRVNMFDICC